MRKRTSPANQNADNAATGNRRKKRWLMWGVAVLGMSALLLAGLALLAWQTEWGTRILWQTASRMAPGQLSGDFAGGTLSNGIRLRNVVYRDDTKLVKIVSNID